MQLQNLSTDSIYTPSGQYVLLNLYNVFGKNLEYERHHDIHHEVYHVHNELCTWSHRLTTIRDATAYTFERKWNTEKTRPCDSHLFDLCSTRPWKGSVDLTAITSLEPPFSTTGAGTISPADTSSLIALDVRNNKIFLPSFRNQKINVFWLSR